MPSPSPLVLVSDNAGPFVPTFPNGLNIGPGDTVAVVLQSPSGVTDWYLQCGLVTGNPPVVTPGTGTDDLSTAPTITGVNGAGLVTSGPAATVSFTFPSAQGRALLFSSTVTGGFGSITTTFALFSLTGASFRVGPTGLTREGSNGVGWTAIVNPIIRLAGSSGGVNLSNETTPIAGNPHTTLELYGVTAADLGGGVASLTASTQLPFNSALTGHMGGHSTNDPNSNNNSNPNVGPDYYNIPSAPGQMPVVSGNNAFFAIGVLDTQTQAFLGPTLWLFSAFYRTNTIVAFELAEGSISQVSTNDVQQGGLSVLSMTAGGGSVWALDSFAGIVQITAFTPYRIAKTFGPGSLFGTFGGSYGDLLRYDTVNAQLVVFAASSSTLSTVDVGLTTITHQHTIDTSPITGFIQWGMQTNYGTYGGGKLYLLAYASSGVWVAQVDTLTFATAYLLVSASDSLFNGTSLAYSAANSAIYFVSLTNLFQISTSSFTVTQTLPLLSFDPSNTTGNISRIAVDDVGNQLAVITASSSSPQSNIVLQITGTNSTLAIGTTFTIVTPAGYGATPNLSNVAYDPNNNAFHITDNANDVLYSVNSTFTGYDTSFGEGGTGFTGVGSTIRWITPGTAGFVWTSRGPGLIPDWGTPPGPNIYIYQEGGTPSGNLFAHWVDAYTARAGFTGPATILVDDSMSPGNANIPSGSYQLSDTTIQGCLQGILEEGNESNTTFFGITGVPLLTIADGTNFENPPSVLQDIILASVNSSPISTQINFDNPDSITLRNAYLVSNAGTAPLFVGGGSGASYNISLLDGSRLITTGAQPVFNLPGTVPITLRITGSGTNGTSSAGAGTITDDGESTMIVIQDNLGVFGAQAGFTGAITRQFTEAVPFGPTSARPTSALLEGTVFFDTTLQALITWNGSSWVVAGGSAAPQPIWQSLTNRGHGVKVRQGLTPPTTGQVLVAIAGTQANNISPDSTTPNGPGYEGPGLWIYRSGPNDIFRIDLQDGGNTNIDVLSFDDYATGLILTNRIVGTNTYVFGKNTTFGSSVQRFLFTLSTDALGVASAIMLPPGPGGVLASYSLWDTVELNLIGSGRNGSHTVLTSYDPATNTELNEYDLSAQGFGTDVQIIAMIFAQGFLWVAVNNEDEGGPNEYLVYQLDTSTSPYTRVNTYSTEGYQILELCDDPVDHLIFVLAEADGNFQLDRITVGTPGPGFTGVLNIGIPGNFYALTFATSTDDLWLLNNDYGFTNQSVVQQVINLTGTLALGILVPLPAGYAPVAMADAPNSPFQDSATTDNLVITTSYSDIYSAGARYFGGDALLYFSPGAIPMGPNGTFATVTVTAGPTVTVSGLNDMTTVTLPALLAITSSSQPTNIGTWVINTIIDNGDVVITNPSAVTDTGSDAWYVAEPAFIAVSYTDGPPISLTGLAAWQSPTTEITNVGGGIVVVGNYDTAVGFAGLGVQGTVDLPAFPTPGQKVTVTDLDGSLGNFLSPGPNIVINGVSAFGGYNIRGASSYTLTWSVQGAFASVTLQFYPPNGAWAGGWSIT